MNRQKRFIRVLFLVFLGLAYIYLERAYEYRSDFQDAVSQFYRVSDGGQMDSLELYARRITKFKNTNWTFSEKAEPMTLNLNGMNSSERSKYVYEMKEEISDDLNYKIRIIRRLFFGLFIASILILYIIEYHVLKREE